MTELFVDFTGSAGRSAQAAALHAAEREVYALHDELAYAHEELDAVRDDLADALADASGAHDAHADLRDALTEQTAITVSLQRQLARAVMATPARFDGAGGEGRPIPWLRSDGPERWSITDRD